MRRVERLGEKAIRLGYATSDHVERALSEQRAREAVEGKRTPLGAILAQMGAIAPAQLARLLDGIAKGGFHLSEDGVRLAALLQRSIGEGPKSILFTGVRRGDGSDVIAAQVGLALALMDQGPVAIIDCDLRRPSLHERFNLDPGPGVLEVITGRVSAKEALRETGVTGLAVLPAGHMNGEAVTELLKESCTSQLLELRVSRRVVILSAPPALEYPESAMLASRAHGTVIVAAAGVRSGGELAEVERLMEGVGAKVLGVVLSHSTG